METPQIRPRQENPMVYAAMGREERLERMARIMAKAYLAMLKSEAPAPLEPSAEKEALDRKSKIVPRTMKELPDEDPAA